VPTQKKPPKLLSQVANGFGGPNSPM